MGRAEPSGALDTAAGAVAHPLPQEPSDDAAVEAAIAARPVVLSTTGGPAEAIDGFASALPVRIGSAVATEAPVA